jgi:hypothetical protein
MPEVADLIAPVAAGPTRGARYANLLIDPAGRTPLRNVVAPVAHRLDAQPIGTNNNGRPACTLNINITAKSRLLVELATKPVVALGEAARFEVSPTVLTGAAVIDRTAARSIAVRDDVARLVARAVKGRLPRGTRVRHEDGLPYDAGLVLARIEAQDPRATRLDDHEVEVVSHDGGAPHIHDTERRRPGPSYLGVFVQGTYCPGHDVDLDPGGHEHHGDHGHVDGASLHDDEQCRPERFTRILVASTATVR